MLLDELVKELGQLPALILHLHFTKNPNQYSFHAFKVPVLVNAGSDGVGVENGLHFLRKEETKVVHFIQNRILIEVLLTVVRQQLLANHVQN